MNFYNFNSRTAYTIHLGEIWSLLHKIPRKSQPPPPGIKEIYEDFLHTLKYSPQKAIPEDNVTYQSLLSKLSSYDTVEGAEWFKGSCRVSSTIAEVFLSGSSIEDQTTEMSCYSYVTPIIHPKRDSKLLNLLGEYSMSLKQELPQKPPLLQALYIHWRPRPQVPIRPGVFPAAYIRKRWSRRQILEGLPRESCWIL